MVIIIFLIRQLQCSNIKITFAIAFVMVEILIDTSQSIIHIQGITSVKIV